ncbi:MAG: Slp family lipoprotein [Limisphaerales bacterium]
MAKTHGLSFPKERMKRRMGKYVTAVVLLALLSSCASHPIASHWRDRAQPVTFTQARANPETARGTTVIWGGRIIDTVNDTNGGEIYVLKLPFKRGEKPTDKNTSTTGRFIARSHEPLEPAAYPAGCLITVAGTLDGARDQRVQSVLYRYPVVKIEQVYLWTNEAITTAALPPIY